MYKGLKKCACCKTTGAQNPRPDIDDLCYDCNNLVKLGKNVVESEIKDRQTIMVVPWYTTNFRNSSNGGDAIDKAFTSLFKALDTGFKIASDNKWIYSSGHTSGNASERYYVRKDVADCVQGIVNAFTEQQKGFNEKVHSYKNEQEDLFRAKKNAIYNDGVEKGRQLLISLNNGDISMQDFESIIKKF